MPKPGTRAMYEARMKPGSRQDVKDEFEEWVRDMSYEALLGSPATKAYLFEAFVGGWGSKIRQLKRKRKAKKNE